MIKVVHATSAKGVPVSMASGAVRAVLRSNVGILVALFLKLLFTHSYSLGNCPLCYTTTVAVPTQC